MKKIISIVLCMVCILSICAVGYAANSGFLVSYSGGTSDAVTNLPDTGICENSTYGVSNKIPEREGYEFVEWKLDYKQQEAPEYVSYAVQYIDILNNIEIEDSKYVEGIEAEETVTEYAIHKDGYSLLSPEVQEVTIYGGETIYFYYCKTPILR